MKMFRHKNYSFVWILGILFIGLVPQMASAGTLSCSITTAAACTGGTNTIILRMSGSSNAHAELPGQANANYDANVICCSGVTGLGNSCSGTFATALKLSGVTNAHSEENSQANYANSACISVAAGTVSVGYQPTNCIGFDTTLGSMSGVTNAHVGNSAAYPSIQICATAAATPPPTITTYTNSTETGLNWVAACTGCGARIGGGAGFRQTLVITGTNLGADPGAGNRSTGTNNVKIGTHQIASANVTAWSATSITILTDSAVTGDTDADWSTNFGGASALTVTAGGVTTSGLNFYVFPQVTSVTQPAGFPADSAREYNAADSDGVITLNGTRFGTGTTGGSVTIVSTAANTTAWGNTAITAQVPAAIADTTYTGNVALTQGTGSNNKTHTYTVSGFRVLPRITSFTPGSGTYGDAVTVNGDHLCENGGTCPGAFSAANKVTFTSGIDATVFTSWTSTAIVTQVPNSSVTGNVVVTSNTTYTSNGKSFTVVSPVPSDPTSLNQYKNSGLTQAIATGGAASSTPVYLTMTMTAPISGGTLYPQIEYKPIGSAFVCSGTSACGSATEGTGVAGPGPIDCSSVGNACAVAISPADNVYHWQARVRHNIGGTDYYSAWVPFPTPSANLESATDIQIDTTGAAITNISSGTPGSNTATITWDTSGEQSTSQVQYNTTGTFVANCATNSDCTTFNASLVFSHSVALTNIDSGTTYYYRVRSKDAAGNETISSTNTLTTSTVSQPAKTIQTAIVSNIAAATTTYFTVVIPETSPAVKSAYVEVSGLVSGGTNPITVQVNGLTALNYATNATNPTFVRMLYKVADQNTSVTESLLNFNDAAPCTNGSGGSTRCNKLIITPGSGMTIAAFSARLIMTYAYTP